MIQEIARKQPYELTKDDYMIFRGVAHRMKIDRVRLVIMCQRMDDHDAFLMWSYSDSTHQEKKAELNKEFGKLTTS